jgi:hypothetical protein
MSDSKRLPMLRLLFVPGDGTPTSTSKIELTEREMRAIMKDKPADQTVPDWFAACIETIILEDLPKPSFR